LAQRQREQRIVCVREQVENDVAGRRLRGEPLDPRGRRVYALPESVEVLVAVCIEHEKLAVEHVASRWRAHLGEVAIERLAAARLQEHVLTVHEREAAETVELD